MKIVPARNHVVVIRSEAPSQSKGGILLPDTSKGKANRGEVLAVGGARILENGVSCNLEYEAGDVVLFSEYAGHDVEVDGVKYLILQAESIIGTLTK